MSIAQKLKAIADNQPKVYEAGGRTASARLDGCLTACNAVLKERTGGIAGECDTAEELPQDIDIACTYMEHFGEEFGRQDTYRKLNECLEEVGAEPVETDGNVLCDLFIGRAYDAGKEQEYNDFWDAFQQSGARTSYAYAFVSWELQYFRPKYDLVPRNATYMFREFSWLADLQSVDLEELLGNCDIRLDFSNCTSWDAAFFYSGISRLGVVDMSAYTNGYRFFSGCGELVTIDELILNGDTNYNWEQAFNGCRKLENLTISGVLPAGHYNQIKFGDCTKLTHDSLLSILGALKDYSEDTSGTTRTIQLGSTNRNKLTSDELAIATNKGWTVT